MSCLCDVSDSEEAIFNEMFDYNFQWVRSTSSTTFFTSKRLSLSANSNKSFLTSLKKKCINWKSISRNLLSGNFV